MSKKKQTTKNVPELRFPEFGGEWEEKKLNDLGKYKKSYTFSRAKEGSGKYKHVHYGDIHTKLPSIIKEASILPSITEEKNFSVVEKGDLIFADASEDYEDLGKATMVDFDDTNVISGLHTHLFRPNENIIPHFLIYYTETQRYKRHIKREGNGISVLGISKTNLGKLLTFLPSIQEQQKIGDFFSKLDRQIELEEKKLALLEEQKKGYMQKIFSQKLRFKDENGNDYPEWEEKELKDISTYLPSKRNSNSSEVGDTKNQYAVYDANEEIFKDSNYDSYKPYISILKDGAGVGRISLRGEKTSVISTMGYIHNYEVDLLYLFYLMKTLDFRKYIIGSTIPHLYYKDYSNEQVFVSTSFAEQQKIGGFLAKLEKRIVSKKLKVCELKKQKQSLLGKLFCK